MVLSRNYQFAQILNLADQGAYLDPILGQDLDRAGDAGLNLQGLVDDPKAARANLLEVFEEGSQLTRSGFKVG